ncbi:MAG: hypothetical protein HUJ68_12745 [Clostridia bacterium]|nr:hypothetical protein [Clostridia bacterium]
MAVIDFPRLNISSGVLEGTQDIQLTPARPLNPSSPSLFPKEADTFRDLNYTAGADSILQEQLVRYYELLTKITAGRLTAKEARELDELTVVVQEHILTDEDYNLIVESLRNIETYLLQTFWEDTNKKAAAMDKALNTLIDDLNQFMQLLEELYSKSPNDVIIPNGSIVLQKLEPDVQIALEKLVKGYSIIVSNTKPKDTSVIWFNTGTPIE